MKAKENYMQKSFQLQSDAALFTDHTHTFPKAIRASGRPGKIFSAGYTGVGLEGAIDFERLTFTKSNAEVKQFIGEYKEGRDNADAGRLRMHHGSDNLAGDGSLFTNPNTFGDDLNQNVVPFHPPSPNCVRASVPDGSYSVADTKASIENLFTAALEHQRLVIKGAREEYGFDAERNRNSDLTCALQLSVASQPACQGMDRAEANGITIRPENEDRISPSLGTFFRYGVLDAIISRLLLPSIRQKLRNIGKSDDRNVIEAPLGLQEGTSVEYFNHGRSRALAKIAFVGGTGPTRKWGKMTIGARRALICITEVKCKSSRPPISYEVNPNDLSAGPSWKKEDNSLADIFQNLINPVIAVNTSSLQLPLIGQDVDTGIGNYDPLVLREDDESNELPNTGNTSVSTASVSATSTSAVRVEESDPSF
eukprot:scaffold188117_cov52-Attheya_sp.AAC.1